MKRRSISAIFFVGFWAALHLTAVAQDITHEILESYPEEIVASLEQKQREAKALPPQIDGNSFEFVYTIGQRWLPGQKVKVAFLDGDVTLHREVARIAEQLESHANVDLDFGGSGPTGPLRTWSTSDSSHRAEIRVSFDMAGYWSLVGTDSIDTAIGLPTQGVGGRPGQRSMNFGGFKSQLPPGWEATVLHEFGHALGFHHEHQSPIGPCEAQFRWDDDPGYLATRNSDGGFIQDTQGRRPGIYTVLSGPPNGWSAKKVDHNLRQITDSHAFEFGPFDSKSIMKYYFPSWMFKDGAGSGCFSAGRNLSLSPQDVAGLEDAYPGSDALSEVLEEREGVLSALQDEAAVDSGLKDVIESQLKAAQSLK